MSETDLGLRVPISGVQLIEASAGTGKTFTLATLYARLVIEARLPVSKILAVTFTEAATKELRERLRSRLVLALAVVDANDGRSVADAIDHETALTQTLVDAALAREGADALRRRLRLACEHMDLAPIYTIHGFCHRALADHALDAGQPLLERELIGNDSALREEVALQFWRQQSRAPDSAQTLSAIWSSPTALAASLRDLVEIDVLLPAPAPARASAAQVTNTLRAARDNLARQFIAQRDTARALLKQACIEGNVHAGVVGDKPVDNVWQLLDDWLLSSRERDPPIGKLRAYGSACLQSRVNKKGSGQAPKSPLFDAIEDWVSAAEAGEALASDARVSLVHEARRFALQRMAELKHERGLLGFDDMIRGVSEALRAADGSDFARRLQEQYSVALVDEFQDTDARQWEIFQRLFAAPREAHTDAVTGRALFLIGDPKQAIYRFRGGDVYTYLAAARHVDGTHRLQQNFRSRPLVLAALQALFDLAGQAAFAQPGIDFEPVHAGGRCLDAHWLIEGGVAPGLTVLELPEVAREAVDDTRERAAQACVSSIHALLSAGRDGRALRVDRRGQSGPVAPGDIAVLVEKNADAERMQQALSRVGIPSVAAGRSSLYASDEAQDLRCLLLALISPGDEQRLRAALATPLLGMDATELLRLDGDEPGRRGWQDRLQRWQHKTQRHGPVALLTEVCADNAPRLLGWLDGERRLSNYLQLAEELQTGEQHRLGAGSLLLELEQRIAHADDRNEAELLRLESDSERVKILTLHRSKGLEFDFVFLPFAATNGERRNVGKPALARYHDGQQRVAQLYPEAQGSACAAEAEEERAEKLRLLYVGLTRARLATWIVWGATASAHKSALAWLLHRHDGPVALDPISIERRLQQWRALAPDAISIEPALEARALPRLALGEGQETPAAAVARRTLDRDWWVHSFSQLSREDSGDSSGAANDEIDAWPDRLYSRFSGTRFGNTLHAVLEQAPFPAWFGWQADEPPPGQRGLFVSALKAHGYGSADDQAEGIVLLTRLVRETLNTRMPEGSVLAALPEHALCREMEFHLALSPTVVGDVLRLLHAHGVVATRSAFGLRQRLEGLLTGSIDLVYTHEGRYYVLDYKSNQLRDYQPDTVTAAVRDGEYDLQYVLYSLALHRWLRFRMGAGYTAARHLGGVRYLFCRGLDHRQQPSPGIQALRLPISLIEDLDALLQPRAAA